MKKLVLLVGVPGSGKTTLSKRLLDRGYLSFNADSIRQELWGDANDQRDPDKVFQVFWERVETAMAEGKDLVIDNTNTNPMHRAQVLERAKRFEYSDVQLWILDVPLEVCLERNRARGRAVPEDIVTNMHNTLYGPGKPKKHEGRLVIIRPGKEPFEFRFFLPK